MNIAFQLEKIDQQIRLLESLRYRQQVMLPQLDFAVTTSDLEQDWEALDWHPFPYNQYWGEYSQSFAMRTRYQIPQEWDVSGRIALHLPLGNAKDAFEAHPEALIHVDGVPFTAVDAQHSEIVLPEKYKDTDEHQLHLHGWTGLGDSLFGDDKPHLYLHPCKLVWIDEATHDFRTLARIALDVATHLPDNSLTRQKLIGLLQRVLRQIDTRHPTGERTYDSIASVLPQLQEGIQSIQGSQTATIHAVGHAHIDTAWLWTLDITRGKVARTFHTAIHLMNQYPDYYFVQSQPQLYDYLSQSHPDLFAEIQAKAQSGQWEPLGGMWVEPDCNVPNGESLARQFLYGQRYLKEHFGQYSQILWLPDTFGFSHTLPQIAKQAGIDYFFTTKLRWNESNELPNDTFIWRGLDGSELLSHFTPTPMQHWLKMPTYNANLNAQSAIETWERMHDKATMHHSLMVYGYGDGGGGPTPKMLDALEHLQNFPDVPKIKPTQAREFFETVAETYHDLPVWDGALYLETHQGTFTSQAWIKRANQQAEVILHDTEFLAVWAMLLDEDYDYPKDALDEAWHHVLLHQFHDILPGSSIKEVYDDARIAYNNFFSQMEALKQNALDALSAQLAGDVVIINTIGFDRADLAFWKGGSLNEGEYLVDANDKIIDSQKVDGGYLINGSYLDLSPYNITVLNTKTVTDVLSIEDAPQPNDIMVYRDKSGNTVLDNTIVEAVFDKNGNLNRLTGRYDDVPYLDSFANQFQIFEDRPLRFDAWNIDPDFESKQWLAEPAESIEIIEQGALRATLKIVRRVMNSTITQLVRLTRYSSRLDFETHIDWQERNMLLKVAFPLAISPQELYAGVQWGETRIPIHRNTSWERASYERPFQNYVRAVQGDTGIALLADCKYGFDYKENTLRLTLLKGATYPDPTADLGEHHFTYSFMIGGDSSTYSLQKSMEVQHPLMVLTGTGQKQVNWLFATSWEDNAVIETIKRAEDSNKIILRVRETAGNQSIVRVHSQYVIEKAEQVNILEEHIADLPVNDAGGLSIPMKPYQVMTIAVTLAGIES